MGVGPGAGGPGGAAVGGARGGQVGESAAASAMIEKEKHKLEVLKRRQEKDIQQVRGRWGRKGAWWVVWG